MNNAGVSYDHPEYLADTDDAALHDMLAINALVPVMVGGRVPARAGHVLAAHAGGPRHKTPTCVLWEGAYGMADV